MLTAFHLDSQAFRLTTSNIVAEENKFTVIVGKNGTGKSRILKSIVETFVNPDALERIRSDGLRLHPTPFLLLEYDYKPSSVIAISTSPFDRFPLPKYRRRFTGQIGLNEFDYPSYEYLGLRGLFSQNLSLSFMSRTITSLIEAVHENAEHAQQVCSVLNYLKYDGSIEAIFQLSFSSSKLNEILAKDDPEPSLRDYISSRQDGFRIGELFMRAGPDVIDKIIYPLRRFLSALQRQRIDIKIDRGGVVSINHPDLSIDKDFVFFLELGLLRLREVSLKKNGADKRIRLNEASSGEQSVVMGFLGIAAYIRDGSLICVDEPEICLHPEWQERYIQLLISTFRSFKRCHFVIATHSPQIVSRLEQENCFVLNIESGETIDAKELIKKSSDFQLANTFGAPGYKNEYLSRELIMLLTHFSKSGVFSKEQTDLARKLLRLKPLLDESDPVGKLMSMLEEILVELTQ